MLEPLKLLLSIGSRRPLNVFYDERYRFPFATADARIGTVETRRADEALRYLFDQSAIAERSVHIPAAIRYVDLSLVHSDVYLESLHRPESLGRIFAIDASALNTDEVLRTLRLACGGTLAAARLTMSSKVPSLNMLGGFHHAAPDKGAGFCALNDVAVAVAVLRSEGFDGRIAVLDLDFHPPDGTAACLGEDAAVWLGSISGESWGPLENVDETVLPSGTDDSTYLEALEALLSRVPDVALVFVLAGGDVLAGDALGHFALSLGAVRRRDLMVGKHFEKVPQVWLPAGGYSAHAWKVLAGTGMALSLQKEEPISPDYDPVGATLLSISGSLTSERLSHDGDVLGELFDKVPGARTVLGFYTAEGIEYALERYRILPFIRRLGFEQLRVDVDEVNGCDRARVWGTDDKSKTESVLMEAEFARRRVGEFTVLFVNWLSLRNPRAAFGAKRPKLPGQEVPGLGLAREVTKLFELMAQRLVLDGVAFRPSWFHMAYAGRHSARFLDPARQGRFEALLRDLASVPLLEATRAVAEGMVTLNGAPYRWEADEMVQIPAWQETEAQAEARREARENSKFLYAG
jgi:acetoin utilization deacetylase AcuC-like enzyme